MPGRHRPGIGGRGPYGKTMRPVGSEYIGKDGVPMVKVREWPSRPGSKDNWRLKNVVVWERSRGLALPSGWIVIFCDGDRSNFAPENLKAVPRRLIGVMNSGPAWSDRPSCEAAAAVAMVKVSASDAVSKPRRCGVCGREFTPDNRSGMQAKRNQRTCRECLDKGLRAPKDYGEKACPVCGRRFAARSARSVYCSKECRSKAYRSKNA